MTIITGNVANFSTKNKVPLKAAKLEIVATQDFNGQTGPYPSGGQLWDEEWELGGIGSSTGSTTPDTDRIRSKNFCSCAPSTTYYFVIPSKNISIYFYDTNYEFISYEGWWNSSRTFTTPNNCQYFKIGGSSAYGTTYKNDISINYPATDMVYHPYSNICPINGADTVKLTRCGKNLVDVKTYDDWEKTNSYYYVLPNVTPNSVIRASFIDKDPTIDLQGVSFGFIDSNWDRVHALQVDQYHWINRHGVIESDTTNRADNGFGTILTGLFIYPRSEEAFNKFFSRYDIEFEVNTATEYEQYKGITQTIQLGSTCYGGYVIQSQDGRRKLVCTKGIYNLTGTELWNITGTGAEIRAHIEWASYGMNKKPDDYNAKTNRFSYGSAQTDKNTFDMGLKYLRFNIYGLADSRESFNTWIQNNPTYVVYELAEPVVIDLTDGEPVNTLLGMNNVYCDNGETEVDVPNYFKCASIHATQNSNVVIDTASGSIANFETLLAMPLLDTQIDVNAVQDLHGQSGVYPAGGGINKWDEEWINGYLSSTDGSYISDANSICSKNFTEIQANTNYFLYKASSVPNTYICWYDVNQTFMSRELVNNSVVASPNNAKYFKVSSYGYGTTYNNNISINYPATDTSYHPYSNICPINGVSEVKVGYCDFNQLATLDTSPRQGLTATMDTDGVISLSGVATNSYSNITKTITPLVNHIYFIIKSVISNPNNINFSWSFLNAVKSPYTPGTSETQYTLVKVVSESGSSTGISGFTAGTDFEGVKIKVVCIDLTQALGKEKANYLHTLGDAGVTIARQLFTKDYYPYNEGGTLVSLNDVNGKSVCPVDSIQLGDTYYGGRFIQDKSGKRKFKNTFSNKINIGDLNGWGVVTKAGHTCFFATLPNGYISPLTSDELFKGICSSYKVKNDFNMSEDNVCIFYSSSGWGSYSRIMIRDDSASNMTPTEFKAYVTGQIIYELNNPIIIDLPDGTPFKSLPGVNNIFADTGDTAVKFRKIGE